MSKRRKKNGILPLIVMSLLTVFLWLVIFDVSPLPEIRSYFNEKQTPFSKSRREKIIDSIKKHTPDIPHTHGNRITLF